MAEAERIARASRAQSIRLDARDTPARAGALHAGCSYARVDRAVYRGTLLICHERMF
jgi:hypothetical protein